MTESAPTILVVCTANICRSPAAAALLRTRLDRAGVDAVVTSAGAGTTRVDEPADELMASVARRSDLSLAEHRNRPMTADLVRGADLVVTMERRHLREAAVMAAGSWHHVYTLRELVRRASAVGRRGVGESLDQWLHSLHDGRTSAMLMRDDPADDIADPTGGALSSYEATWAELESLVAELVAWGWPRVAG